MAYELPQWRSILTLLLFERRRRVTSAFCRFKVVSIIE